MLSKTRWLLQQTLRRTWVRVVAFAVLAVVTVVATRLLAPWIPADWAERIGADAVDQVLGILASSMLAVTTFSLSIAVSAYASASSGATPRATRLLQEDRTTQNVLATFLGAFLFGLVGIILLKAGYFNEGGRLVLFATTIIVVAGVVAALLRWISHLMRFGRMSDTLDRVEDAATAALEARLAMPYLGGRPWRTGDAPADAAPVHADAVGYVQHVDMAALAEVGERLNADCHVAVLPGGFIHHGTVLVHLSGNAPDEAACDAVRGAFTTARDRTFEQDPRFGAIVLAEIASRALSPAVNDPGTAISVLGRLVRLLSRWAEPVEPEIRYPRLHVPPILPADLLDDGFGPIARDGAAMVEVQCHLQEALAALASRAPTVFAEAARAQSARALAHAEAALALSADRDRLRHHAAEVERTVGGARAAGRGT